MNSIKSLISEILSLKNPEKIKIYQGFFKTGKWEYGEGDVFLGLTVPQTRGLVKKYAPEMTLDDVDILLSDKHHEVRFTGVLILVYFAQKKRYPLSELARFYMQHASRINNWDLVDVSSEHIIGPYIQHELNHEERVDFITKCIASSNLWINRIIVLASFYQIKQGNGKLTIYIAERMLTHKHDLIHKAIGWMLREVGKRCSMEELRGFLDQYAPKMPRTMLRYAIEKMDEDERGKYMAAQ
jgi:3-methyladenine DNA glycosylase AlkD